VKNESGVFAFDQVLLPILIQTKDVELLNLVLAKDYFVISMQDFKSFVAMTISLKWTQGIISFLQS
jgi:hypothetical protein